MLKVIIIICCIVLLILYILSYKIRYDTIVAFTGGLGSGKSLLSVKLVRKLLKKVRKQTRFKNFIIFLKNIFRKKTKKQKYLEKPMCYTSIPIRISKKEMSLELKESHLLLQERLSYRAIVYIDEIGSFASQFEYKNPNIVTTFDEFIRLFRHYTKGGYLVCNDQCSENIVLQVRRRINTVFNLMRFRKWFHFFYTVKIRNISISEEIKTIEERNTEDNMKTAFGFMLPKGTYDTYCYSERYNTVPFGSIEKYKKLKKNKLLKVSKLLKETKTNNID